LNYTRMSDLLLQLC